MNLPQSGGLPPYCLSTIRVAYLVLVRPTFRVRKLSYVLAVGVSAAVGLVMAAIAMVWITTGNSVSVNVNNDSASVLRHVVVTAPSRSAPFDSLSPGASAGFSSLTSALRSM